MPVQRPSRPRSQPPARRARPPERQPPGGSVRSPWLIKGGIALVAIVILATVGVAAWQILHENESLPNGQPVLSGGGTATANASTLPGPGTTQPPATSSVSNLATSVVPASDAVATAVEATVQAMATNSSHTRPTTYPTDTPTPTTPTSVPSGGIPTGEWTVRSYKTDDAAVIFVNGHLVGGSEYKRDSDWLNIDDYLLPGQINIVAFASFNGGGGGTWGFSIRRDDVSVWGSEESVGDRWTLTYAQQVAIHPDGTVEALPFDVSVRTPPAGKWYVRAQSVQDVGGVLVNGQPVTVNWDNHDADWVDITGLLYSGQDNALIFSAWNFEGNYSWDFALKHNEEILWAVSNNGSGQTGIVLAQDVIISGNGQVQW